MGFHQIARQHLIAGFQRVQNLVMLVHTDFSVVLLRDLVTHGQTVPQTRQQFFHGVVVGCSPDRHVERLVLRAVACAVILRQRGRCLYVGQLDGVNVCLFAAYQYHSGAFQRSAGLVVVAQALLVHTQHDGSAVGAQLNQPLPRQHLECLADRRRRHAQLGGGVLQGQFFALGKLVA